MHWRSCSGWEAACDCNSLWAMRFGLVFSILDMDESNVDGHIHDSYKAYRIKQGVWYVAKNNGDALSMLEDPCLDIEKMLTRAKRVLIHGRESRLLSELFLVTFGKWNNSKTIFKVQKANEDHACSCEILQVHTRQRIPHRASEEVHQPQLHDILRSIRSVGRMPIRSIWKKKKALKSVYR